MVGQKARGDDASRGTIERVAAADEELPALLDRTVRESLSPAEIKRAVKTWARLRSHLIRRLAEAGSVTVG